MQPLAPQAFPTVGQAPAPALAGNALDGSSGPWRKEAGGATAAGPPGQAATPAARPQARFTTLLESLVSAGEAGNAPAVKKEDGPQAAFWMAVETATPQVSHPAKPAEGAAETEDGVRTNNSLAAERAASPETSGDAAALVKMAPQPGAPPPVEISTPMSDWPDAPEDRAELPPAAAPAMENRAPDSKLAAGTAASDRETAGGAAAESQRFRNAAQAGAEAEFRQTAGDRRAGGGRQDRNEAAAEQETTGSPTPRGNAPDDPRSLTPGAPIGAGPSGRPVREGLCEDTKPCGQRPGGAAAKSQRVPDVAQAGTEVKLPQTASARSVAKAGPSGPQARTGDTEVKLPQTASARSVAKAGIERLQLPAAPPPQTASARSVAKAGPSAPQARTGGTENRPAVAPEQQAVRGRSDGLQVSSTARIVPAQTQLPAAGLPAAERPAAGPVLEPDRPPRPRREGRSPSQSATGKNGETNAGTVSGQPLAAPTVAQQTTAASQADSITVHSGGASETAAAGGQPATSSAPAALEPQDDAMETSEARPMVVAFTARLRPVAAAPEAPGGEAANSGAEPVETAKAVAAPAATGETGHGRRENLHDTPAASTGQPDVSREPVRKPEVSAAGAPEPAVTARPATAPQPPAANDARPRESTPDSPPPAAATEPAAAPAAPKPAAAHDIKLELAGQGDRRVEVRVSERAGDMHVEVRTPNSGLAGELREDLPALASKLEQTGFRAETWHPAGTAERQRTAEAAPGAASQNSERQPGQNGGQRQRDPQPQPKPKVQENDTPSPDAGKDFAWLFSSIP
ncbi:MAG: hypothetical protein ABSB88_13375 [Bryobacteraceae bacterium]